MQPGYPGQDPYGQQPPQYGQDPQYGQQPQYGTDPYGQPQQPQYGDPYGQPTSGQPYGQPTSGQPYGQPTSGQPYGQPTSGQPYGQPAPGQPYPVAPGYPAAGYGPVKTQNNTMGLLAMIFGIAAIPLVFCCYIGVPLGIAAIVLGILGKNKADQGLANNRGQALAGLICGASAIALMVVLIVLTVALDLGSTTYNF